MPTRVHVHLKVKDLDRSRAFYEHFFGRTPVKVKADQVKFLPPWAPVNLALSVAHRGAKDDRAGGTEQGAAESARRGQNSVNHLGVEVDSGEAVMAHLARVKAAGIATRDQLNVNCCYANQSKFWVIDPDGVEWEIYHVNHDLVEKHGGGTEQIAAAVS